MRKTLTDPRTDIVASNDREQDGSIDGVTPHTKGRMVRSRRYKYCAYHHGERRESLVDLENDSGEMVNPAGDPKHHNVMQEHRQMLAEWCARFDTKWSHLNR